MKKTSITRRDKPSASATGKTMLVGHEVQGYGHSVRHPLALSGAVCNASIDLLNQLLADLITLRDLYRKHHWQVSGPTFYPLHLLFDKHASEADELIDAVAERVQTLGGVCIATGADVSELTIIPRAPKGREVAADQLARLLHAHEIILQEARAMIAESSKLGDDGTADLITSSVVRQGEMQVWFLFQHVVPSTK